MPPCQLILSRDFSRLRWVLGSLFREADDAGCFSLHIESSSYETSTMVHEYVLGKGIG